MTLLELLRRIENKLASRDVNAIDLRASFSSPEWGKGRLEGEARIDWTIEVADETAGSDPPYYPILRVWTDAESDVVECDTFDAIDEARWAAIAMGLAAAPLREPAEVPF